MPEQNDIKKDEALDEVVEVNLDEVIQVGDPRHGVHDPVVPTRDVLNVHEGQTPEQVFGSPPREESQIDLPESDLEGADGRRGAVVRTLGKGAVETPEQHFTEVAVAEDQPGAAKAKADADSKAKADDGKSSRSSG